MVEIRRTTSTLQSIKIPGDHVDTLASTKPPSLQSITANNSGVKIRENPDISVVEAEIDELIRSMNEISKANLDLIKSFGKRTFAVRKGAITIDNINDRKILADWDERKSLLKYKLRLFFQLRFNPDLEIKESLLESLGFKRCKRCH